MPAAERRDFGKFLRRWQEFSTPREGKFAGSDYVALTNFRDANRKVGARLALIAASLPTSPASHGLQDSPAAAPAMTTGRMVAGLLLGLGGMIASYKVAEHVNSRKTGMLS